MALPGGVRVIDKPIGVTSFAFINEIKRQLGAKKVGHAGTLDPMASGLLIIGIDRGTKELKNFVGLDKEYEAEILLGTKTDTGDLEGSVVETGDVPELKTDDISDVLASMTGEITLPAPIYSALKRGGEPLYKKVRRGEEVKPSPVVMEIKRAELISIDSPKVKVLFEVGSGTYVRSLAEEFGKRLGTVATLSALRRTKVGEWTAADVETI